MDFEPHSPVSTLSPAVEPAFTWPGTMEGPGERTRPDLESLLAALEHQRIAALAYFFWQERGAPVGSPDDDWLRAERYIRGR
jgi:hypothetical protein